MCLLHLPGEMDTLFNGKSEKIVLTLRVFKWCVHLQLLCGCLVANEHGLLTGKIK